ncbi:acetyltransferase [Prochlorothrix hollandica PCC 9006 = CALU 1027]|uniref:Acetyltransferase n=1 Tax=Prochlorothrix hollandica PCC 9006 = CALU 1027 TaxID=317619 RepID=A0A0M2PSY7_PROHO|nr:acetyltransferase [Prochlorothrix hollandica PCC 9006 = CALU 1027]
MTPWTLVLGFAPDVAAAAFVAANASVLGQVSLGFGSSIWYTAVLRADVAPITVGAYTNIQDGAVVHCDLDEPVILGDYVTIGHRAVIHSARIDRGCLIGIGAIVLNGVHIGEGSIVGAGSVVTRDVPPGSLVMGVPGKVVREVSPEQAAHLLIHAQRYTLLAQEHAHQQGH